MQTISTLVTSVNQIWIYSGLFYPPHHLPNSQESIQEAKPQRSKGQILI